VTEDAVALKARVQALFWPLKPCTFWQLYLIDEIGLLTLRLERAQRIERRSRDKVAFRAMTSWEDDRRLEAERIGRDLAARPSEVVAELRRTPQGCDWLLERWAGLANLAEGGKAWPEDCRRLAFDLLGTPPEFRAGNPGATIDPDGRPIDPGDDHAALARARIESLRLDREVAAELDEVDRALAEADLTDEATPELRRIRRYESALHHRLRWCMARFQDPVPNRRIPDHLILKVEPEADAEAPSEVSPEIPIKAKSEVPNEAKSPDPAPSEEPGEPETGPELAPSAAFAVVSGGATPRREGRALKAEARRDARRRKLDRRRA